MARVLVIEDNPANMKLAVFLLEKAGYTVIQARDAETGLALARAEHPELILMDIQLPGMDGLVATRALKSDPETASIKIIAVTAHAMKAEEAAILASGCDGYIPKPIRYKDFIEDIRLILARNQQS